MEPLEQENKLHSTVLPLLTWYQENARVLPWRTDHSPYRVWISEIMLQQTRVAAVIGYFNRFTERLPDVQALAAIPEDELLKLWQGLGYYNRARNLQRAAREIVERHGGEMPRDYPSVLALPGIGEYTAGAICSIAFGLPQPAVDGNVLRVLTRILGDERDIAAAETKAAFRSLLSQVIPREAPGEFNQALMELGATVCLPNGAPKCGECPVREICEACRSGRTGELPVKSAKRPRRVEERIVYLIFHGDKIALRKRPKKGLLAGLWEFPNELKQSNEALTAWGIGVTGARQGPKGKHIFTHIEWRMESLVVEAGGDALPEDWSWAKRWELERVYAVPNAFQSFEPEVQAELARREGRPR